MALNIIPEQIIDARLTVDGIAGVLAMVDATLPSRTKESADIDGAGIAGGYSSPTIGRYESGQMSITFRSITGNVAELLSNGEKMLTLRVAQQAKDGATGAAIVIPVRYVIRGAILGLEDYEATPSEVIDVELQVEWTMLKEYRDGVEVFAHDKINYISRINGVDQLAGVRAALGG